MPRPRKCRRVCCIPPTSRFGPLEPQHDLQDVIIMTVDEYETIRLMDLEDMTQEDCARQMGVARTTVQGIYEAARKKLAKTLVEGCILRIEGGSYRLCEGGGCSRKRCQGRYDTKDKKL